MIPNNEASAVSVPLSAGRPDRRASLVTFIVAAPHVEFEKCIGARVNRPFASSAVSPEGRPLAPGRTDMKKTVITFVEAVCPLAASAVREVGSCINQANGIDAQAYELATAPNKADYCALARSAPALGCATPALLGA